MTLKLEKGQSHSLEAMFHPRSVAVIGASNKEDNWATKGFLQPLVDFGFPGRLFPVNPSASTTLGLKAYPRVSAIPEPVDFVIISVPLDQVLPCIEDCAQKGVKTVCVYTAGFSESGTETGKDTEAQIIARTRQAGMRLLGPNCIGIYCPQGSLSFSSANPRESGHVAFISQSGRYSGEFVAMGVQRGIYFSKVVSYGNAADINETDLLDYLGKDAETHLVTSYMEGVRGGQMFKQVLGQAARAKPVIILKGGFTEAGRRAAQSHTASLTGYQELWQAVMRQAGAISANDLEELSDLAMTFQLIPRINGSQVAVVGAGGGASVLISDLLSKAGFKLPLFSADVQKRLRQFIPLSGTGVTNPVDFSPQTAGDPVLTPLAADTVGQLESVHLVLVHYTLGRGPNTSTDRVHQFCQGILDSARKINKPMAVVLEWLGFPETAELAFEIKQKWVTAGICVFPSLSSAALCLGKRAAYLGLIK